MKNSLFGEDTLLKIQKTRKIFLKFAVWILIAELVLGAVLILMGSWDIAIGRIQGTFLILALILFVGVNNFDRIEKGNKTIQIFAFVGFISSLICGAFGLLLMWEIVPFYQEEAVTGLVRPVEYASYSVPRTYMTFYAITMLISLYTAVAGLWVSNVLSIKENIKLVRLLKITAVVCVLYLWIFGVVMTIVQLEYKDAYVLRLYALAGLAGSASWITALAASIISKANDKKVAEPNGVANGVTAQSVPKSEAELRAEIEEKVRREMIEKEIRAKMEAEKPIVDNSSVNSAETMDDKKEGPESA